MPSWNRSLRPIGVTSKKHNLVAQLQGSMRLCLGEKNAQMLQDVDIVDAVRDHGVWITKAGLCHIRFSVCLNGELMCGKDDVHCCIEAIKDCDIWIRLGLRLRYAGEPDPLIASDLAFSIHHPDISSTLITPTSVIKAELQSLSYTLVVTKGKAKSSNRKRRSSTAKAKSANKTRRIEREQPEPDRFYDGLDLVDKQAIDEIVQSLGFGQPSNGVQETDEDLDLAQAAQALVMEHAVTLISMLLNLAAIGTTRPISGFVPDYRISPGQTLCNLAPGVFHYDHLHKLREGAELIPTIARSLGAMRSAESISLRKKVLNQDRQEQTGQASNTPEEMEMGPLCENLQRRLWETMLRHMKAPPLKSKDAIMATMSSPGPAQATCEDERSTNASQTISTNQVEENVGPWPELATYSMPTNPLTDLAPTPDPTSIPFNTACLPPAGFPVSGHQCHQVFAYPHLYTPSNIQPFPLPNPVHYYGYQAPMPLPAPPADYYQREASEQQYQSFEDMLFDM